MAFAQLTYRESLRDIETCLRSISDKLYHMGFRGTIARSTLADANDCDMPQYIRDNTDDEISHAAFLNAFLISKGEDPVDLDAFRPLQGSQATGAKQLLRLTSLLKLNVDLSWYTRYRSVQNPDLGATFNGPFTITGEHPGAEVGTGRGSRPL